MVTMSSPDLLAMAFEPRTGGYDPFEESCSVIVSSRVSNFLAAELLCKFLELQDESGQDPSGGGQSNESQIFRFSGSVRLYVCFVFAVCARDLQSALSKSLHSSLSKSESKSEYRIGWNPI